MSKHNHEMEDKYAKKAVNFKSEPIIPVTTRGKDLENSDSLQGL